MKELFVLLASNNVLMIALVVALVLLFFTVIAIYIAALVQGRSISFWPPKIGERPFTKSRDNKQYEMPFQNGKQASIKDQRKIEDRKFHEMSHKQGERNKVKTEVLMDAEQKLTKKDNNERKSHRKIVGILLTFTWKSEGEIFPITEGRNFIGKGKMPIEDYHCDVYVPQDERMGSTHVLLLCRQGTYLIIDSESSNGTFLNDQMLTPNVATELPNYAKIKTGHTIWLFIKVVDQDIMKNYTLMEVPKELELKVRNLMEIHST